MNAIESYSPNDSNLHLTLPHDHANSTYSTSPFTYKLDHEFDFAEIHLVGDTQETLVALDHYTVAAIVWAITCTKQIINRATRGIVPAVAVSAPIPEFMYKNLGMDKPRLVALLESTQINPLRNLGKRSVLQQIFQGLQQLGREAIDWIIEARWRSQLLGDQSLWNWEDPRVLRPLAPFVRDPRLLAAPAVDPRTIKDSTGNSAGGTTTPPNSPTSAILPFDVEDPTGPIATEDDGELVLQLVLHPKLSRYAMRYPLFDVFKGEVLIDNGYIGEDDEGKMDAMDVDSD
ncbi:hypothetical protein H1R20_g14808, partial [Candolleomyces eurysporus]